MPWREEIIRKELEVIGIKGIESLKDISLLPISQAKRIIQVSLEWACCAQNTASIVAGRSLFEYIPPKWLRTHLITIVRDSFDYRDDWNYRRLMELIMLIIPEQKGDFLALNEGTDDPDLMEIIKDFACTI